MSFVEWDSFFYYNEIPDKINDDIQNDLLIGILQKEKGFYFNRQDSAGVTSKENFPDGLSLFIGIKYKITKWIGFRNSYVSDNSPDLRIGSSQEAIEINSDRKGNSSVQVLYVRFRDRQAVRNVSIPILE